MKAILTVVTISLLGSFTACQGQIEASKNAAKISDTTKQMNLLDEQTKILSQVFTLGGAKSDDNQFAGTTNYLELIEKTEMSEEQKKELREIYKLYDLSLDPKKKVEFETKVNKKLKEAIDKSISDSNNQILF